MSFPRYPEYKDSEIDWLGNVPSHWGIVQTKRLFQIVGGSTPKSDNDSYWDGDIVWITPADLSQLRSFEILDSARRITADGLASCGTTMVPKGSIVLSTRAPIGSLGISDVELCTNQGCKCLIAVNKLDPRFYAYMFSIASTQLNIMGKGTTFLELSGDALAAFELVYPPHQEQSAIAVFLDRETAKIDALVAEQEKLIELLKEKRQAVISHAVTKGLDPNTPMKDSGVEWLGEVPEHWAVAKLRRFVRAVQTGGTPSASPPNTDIEDGTDWFTPGDFSGPIRLGSASKKVPPEAIEHGEAKVFPAGAVLVVGIGATLGKIGYLLTLASANQQINAILPNAEVDGLFLAYSLSSKTAEMRNLSNASTIGIMNQEKTKEIWVAVPPRCEQETIAKFLDEDGVTSDALVNEAQRAIDLLKERRSALISAAVTGKIDVRGLADATQ